jgi:tetratricopeptide (TPR) repeat protein
MFRAFAAALVLASTPAPRAETPGRVDPDAIREARRGEGGRYASPRAMAHYLEARRRARAGDVERAAEHLRLAVAYDEESPELRVSLAEALALLGQLGAAESEARRGLALAAAGPAAAEAHLLIGRICAARRQPEQAVRAFESAIRIEVTLAGEGGEPDPEPWRLLAAVHLEAGDEGAAVRTLEDLALRLPEDGSGFRELGRALLERRDPGRAERHLRRAVELDARDVEAYRLLAQAHEALRRDPEVRDDLLSILRIDPDDGQALLALGRIALRQGDLAEAREQFQRHVRASSGAADAHVRVVFQWLEGNHGAEALAAARAGIEDAGADPRLRFAEGLALQELRRWAESAEALGAVKAEAGELFVSARLALAEALSRAGRHGEAERALEAPLASSPDDVRLLTTRASVLDRAGRSGDAVALLRRAVAEREREGVGEDVPDLYAALADSLVRGGRADDAVAALRTAVTGRPGDEVLLYALGSAYESAGRRDAAVAQMRALLVLNPDHAEALNFVGYTLAEQGVRLEEAETLVRRALELKPRSGHMLDSLGWVLFRRGDLRRAVELLEQADALAGPDATILEHLGDAYRAASRPADAARAYSRALASVADELPPQQAPRRAALERKLRDVIASAERPGRR